MKWVGEERRGCTVDRVEWSRSNEEPEGCFALCPRLFCFSSFCLPHSPKVLTHSLNLSVDTNAWLMMPCGGCLVDRMESKA
eukprot:scaffold988_cov165-Ochromonas_danica.AAC.27